jgi:hypothetical protein
MTPGGSHSPETRAAISAGLKRSGYGFRARMTPEQRLEYDRIRKDAPRDDCLRAIGRADLVQS